ncbi:MAG: CPBP family intramembrane glutamic endopeptidase [Desulfomonilaceae bacterium]
MKADSAYTQSGSIVGAQFDKREQLIEVAVFLFLIGPSLILSFFLIHQGNISFMLTAVATTLRDFSLLSLILFFLWRNSEPILHIGWTLRDVQREILLGVVLFVPMFLGAQSLEQIVRALGLSAPSTPLPSLEPSRSTLEMGVALVLVTVVAVTEESIFRGYLMLRFKTVFGTWLWSVLLSAFIFSLGHGYEGTAGVVTVGVMGLVLSLVYIWRKSLVAPITMHFLQDFVSIVLLPLLVGT